MQEKRAKKKNRTIFFLYTIIWRYFDIKSKKCIIQINFRIKCNENRERCCLDKKLLRVKHSLNKSYYYKKNYLKSLKKIKNRTLFLFIIHKLQCFIILCIKNCISVSCKTTVVCISDLNQYKFFSMYQRC